jgi:tetraacyldisaccharide 4'-kinase
VYRFLVQLRIGLYVLGYKRQERLAVPVIVVGNVYVGGTGKTPFILWLIEQLQAQGRHPGVLSRGYGGRQSAPVLVDPESDPDQVGDEPVLLARRAGVPVAVCPERGAAGRLLCAAHPQVDVLLADDGLQHYALERTLEIVLFDTRGIGNGWMLPAGPLREPPGRRYDVAILNAQGGIRPPGVPADAVPMRLDFAPCYALADPRRRAALADFQGRSICAVAGIGYPERFFAMLRAAGVSGSMRALPDHAHFSADTLAGIHAEIVLMTEKDAVKCRRVAALVHDPRIWVVPLGVRLEAASAAQLLHMISEKLHGSPSA